MMVRKAVLADLDGIEKNYVELLTHEKEHGAFTVWQLGVYPTRETAEKSLSNGSLYVIERENEICASMILNQVQPKEYNIIKWKCDANAEEVMVVHLLCVPPLQGGCGFGTEMIHFAIEKGKQLNCKAIRLDTGLQNKPAIALYTKLGFELAGTANMFIGGTIEHKNHLFFELKI
ncbi:MAG: GNAT family N-acetyltransferase [Clostridia bacterium]|nr:GNAT family N-acetyltransferase [Clostridia bacterium]